MEWFLRLKSASHVDQAKTGEAVMKLMRSAGDESPGSEWSVFKNNPRAWLLRAGYEYVGPGASPSGEIPANIKLEPVFDTADKMYVRVPWKGTLDAPPRVSDDRYGPNDANRFPIFLARYFVRRCR